MRNNNKKILYIGITFLFVILLIYIPSPYTNYIYIAGGILLFTGIFINPIISLIKKRNASAIAKHQQKLKTEQGFEITFWIAVVYFFINPAFILLAFIIAVLLGFIIICMKTFDLFVLNTKVKSASKKTDTQTKVSIPKFESINSILLAIAWISLICIYFFGQDFEMILTTILFSCLAGRSIIGIITYLEKKKTEKKKI